MSNSHYVNFDAWLNYWTHYCDFIEYVDADNVPGLNAAPTKASPLARNRSTKPLPTPAVDMEIYDDAEV